MRSYPFARCFLRHMVSLDLYAVAPVNTRLSLHTWYLGFSNRRLGLFQACVRFSSYSVALRASARSECLC